MNKIAEEIVGEVNRVRATRGLDRLTSIDVLEEVACSYSRLMAEREFFSHDAPLLDAGDVMHRVRSAGGSFDALGENLAMHGATNSTARDFVDGWMASPGHRDNLLTPEWEVTGVGVFTAESGKVFATQLFGIPAPIALDDVRLTSHPTSWYVVRIAMNIGAGFSLSAFVRNQFIAAADANDRGRVGLECEIPAESGRHHVSFGRRTTGTDDGWIGVYEGTAEIRPDGDGTWHAGPPPRDGCRVDEDDLFRVSGSDIDIVLEGRARDSGILVVDGIRTAELNPGRFEGRASFRSGSGEHTIDVGVPEDERQYRVVRRYRVDADRGEYEPIDAEGQ